MHTLGSGGQNLPAEIYENQRTKRIFSCFFLRMSRVDPQIAQWFSTVDKDHTGRLSADQLQQALRNNNYTTFDLAVVQLGLKTSYFEMILIEITFKIF